MSWFAITVVVVLVIWWLRRMRSQDSEKLSAILRNPTAPGGAWAAIAAVPAAAPQPRRRSKIADEYVNAASPAEQATLRAIDEQSAKDPLAGAKIGAREVTGRLAHALKNERGVRIESLLAALSALAGYACQESVRAQATARGARVERTFNQITTKDGGSYFFSEPVNKLLVAGPHSVWSIVAAGAQQAGCKQLPDVAEMLKHCASVVGSPAFGRPRVPEKHFPPDTVLNCVGAFWPAFQRLMEAYCPNPPHWPVLFSLSIQNVLLKTPGVIDAGIAVRLSMETAVAASKVDLSRYSPPQSPGDQRSTAPASR